MSPELRVSEGSQSTTAESITGLLAAGSTGYVAIFIFFPTSLTD